MADLVRVTADGGIAVVLLNRPETFNALNLEMVRGLVVNVNNRPGLYVLSRPVRAALYSTATSKDVELPLPA